ncbi:MAG: ATP-binding protein [Anaerolineales bacterium]|jgi:serine/threonine-protein kinase RsbW
MHQITRSAELTSLPEFRKYINLACSHHSGIDKQITYDLQLAVDEACTNIITHGYQGMNPGSIILSLEFKGAYIEVTITDFGHAFEPIQTPAPDLEAGLEDRPTGGFGLYFIYQTMDEIEYTTNPYGNRLTFIKKLESAVG